MISRLSCFALWQNNLRKPKMKVVHLILYIYTLVSVFVVFVGKWTKWADGYTSGWKKFKNWWGKKRLRWRYEKMWKSPTKICLNHMASANINAYNLCTRFQVEANKPKEINIVACCEQCWQCANKRSKRQAFKKSW